MSLKGYPDQKKSADGAPAFVTVNPVREQQHGLDVIAHAFHQDIGSDAAEAGSTTRVIVATAHAAIVGDIISWTAGNLDTKEYRVASVAADEITLSETMSEAPGVGDTFDILRSKAAVVTAQGGIGVSLTNDTNFGTPGADTLRTAAMLGVGATAVSNANPVPISDAGGAITVDGTVAITSADLATIAGAVSGTEMQVDVLTSALPTGAATEAKQDSANTLLTTISGAVAGNEMQVDVVTSALPSGAATEAKQDSANALLTTIDADTSALAGAVAGTEVQVDIVASLPAGNNNIGDVDVTNLPATVDTNSGAAGASTLRSVLATRHEAVATPLAVQLSTGSAAIAYGTGVAGSTVPRVVIASDSPAARGRSYSDSARLAYSSTSVTTGAWVQLIASTAAEINSLMLFDSSGQTLELGTGAAASEARVLIIPPGGFDGPVPLRIASGTRVAIRAISATASVGEINITGLS